MKTWLLKWLIAELAKLGLRAAQPVVPEPAPPLTPVFSADWSMNRDGQVLRDFLNCDTGAKFRALLLNKKAELCQRAAFAANEADRAREAAHAKALDTVLCDLTALAGSVNSIQESLSTLGVKGSEPLSESDLHRALDRMATGERNDAADVMGVR